MSKQQLYLYCNNHFFDECFTHNTVLASILTSNKKRNESISTLSDGCLFLTKKKLRKEQRMFVIQDNQPSYPIVLEFTFDDDLFFQYDLNYYMVDSILKYGSLSEYDKINPLGCFIRREVPFSCITKILFENEENLRRSNKSDFPDFLWMDDIVTILKPEEFVEELPFEIFKKTSIDNDNLKHCFLHRNEKIKSAILHLILGTQKWRIGKYETNFDNSLLKLMGLSDFYTKILKETGVQVDNGTSISEKTENIPTLLDMVDSNQSEKFETENKICNALIKQNKKSDSESMKQLLQDLNNKLQNDPTLLKILESSKKPTPFEDFENLYQEISTQKGDGSIYSALLFLVKNPGNYDLFLKSLDVFHATQTDKRNAMTAWGFLNGMEGLPVKEAQRDNMDLWRWVEYKANKYAFNYGKPDYRDDYFKVTDGTLSEIKDKFGIVFSAERKYTCEEVHEFYSSLETKPEKQDFYKKVYDLLDESPAGKKKIKKTGKIYKFYRELELPQLYPDTNGKIPAEEKNEYIERIKKLLTQMKPEYDSEAIYDDFIADKENFEILWKKDSRYFTDYMLKNPSFIAKKVQQ